MNTYVALLRGINVGGRNKLPMKALIAICEDLGCQNVKTYIQSGNVVLQCKKNAAKQIGGKLRTAIEEQHGFAPHVMLLQLDDVDQAIKTNPFPTAAAEPSTLHTFFLESTPKSPNLTKLEGLKKKSESFQLKGKVFYLHAPDGLAGSKLAASVERILGVTTTARNWRTLCKIKELADTLGE